MAKKYTIRVDTESVGGGEEAYIGQVFRSASDAHAMQRELVGIIAHADANVMVDIGDHTFIRAAKIVAVWIDDGE